jgi:hypothetical protein
VLGLLLNVSTGFAAEAEIKAPASESVVVSTKTLLPPGLVKGEGYQLSPTTTVYQGVAIFEMDTDYGTASLVGREGLLTRIEELRAIEQLQEMKGTEVYGKALKSSAMGPMQTAKNLATEPGTTLRDIGRGLGGFLSDVGYAVVSDDPNQDNVAKTAVGFAAAKRQFAYGLGVSSYSGFQPLQDELSDVSWTSVGGGMTVTVAFSTLGGTGGAVVQYSGTAESMRALVRDNSPRKLQGINHDKLIGMGVKEDLAEALLNNFNYDPENATRLVGALASMEGVAGRELFIKVAVLQDQPYNARLMREWAELFAAYHANVQPVKGIVIAQTAPLLVLKDGQVMSIFPADYVAMDPTFEKRYRSLVKELRAQGLEPGEAWTTGKVDPALVPLLQDIGWKKVRGDANSLLKPATAGS